MDDIRPRHMVSDVLIGSLAMVAVLLGYGVAVVLIEWPVAFAAELRELFRAFKV